MWAYSYLWGFLSLPTVGIGLLVLTSVVGAVEFARHESRRKLVPRFGDSTNGTQSCDGDDEKFLIGEWFVRNATAKEYMAVWRFLPNGEVIEDCAGRFSKGTWRLEPTCVHIVWESKQPNKSEHYWDNFNRPLGTHVRGDDWLGHNCVIALKISEQKTAHPLA
jgi:hypothetical protein